MGKFVPMKVGHGRGLSGCIKEQLYCSVCENHDCMSRRMGKERSHGGSGQEEGARLQEGLQSQTGQGDMGLL